MKIANHGVGRLMSPGSTADRVVTSDEQRRFREFVAGTFLALVDAPIVSTRVCVYCDTVDEHFWIARDPERTNLVVATGGSGHAFKFAPLLGEWIADAVEGRTSPALERFRWRAELAGTAGAKGEEAARMRSEETGWV